MRGETLHLYHRNRSHMPSPKLGPGPSYFASFTYAIDTYRVAARTLMEIPTSLPTLSRPAMQ